MRFAELVGRCADPPAAPPPILASRPLCGGCGRRVLPVLALLVWAAVTRSRNASAKLA